MEKPDNKEVRRPREVPQEETAVKGHRLRKCCRKGVVTLPETTSTERRGKTQRWQRNPTKDFRYSTKEWRPKK